MGMVRLRLPMLALAGVLAVAAAAGAAEQAGQEAGQEGDLPKAGRLDPDTPVLRVDGKPVGAIWYERALAQTVKDLAPSSDAHGLDNKMVREAAMGRLVEQEVLYALARREGVPDMQEEVERRFQAFVAKVGGPEAFAQGLAAQGMEERHIRYILERELADAWYVETVVGRDVTVTEEDARSFYETKKSKLYVHPELRRIYQILAAESRGEEDALARLEQVRARYQQGEGFGPLAKEFSDEPASRLSDGFIGVRARSELPEAVGEAVFAATPGELTPVVRSEFGYHLLLVTDVIPPEDKGFDEVKDDVYRRARAIKLKKATEVALKKAGKEIPVEVLLPH